MIRKTPSITVLAGVWALLSLGARGDVIINEFKAESSEWLLRYHDDGSQSVGPGSPWWAPEFDDAAWQTGALPAGNGSNVETDLKDELRNRTANLYVRSTFAASAAAAASGDLKLEINFNDGVIVWLNGIEVARSNMGPEHGHVFSEQLSAVRGSSSTSSFEDFDLGEFAEHLVEGENVLAFQVANNSLSGTMWLDFELQAGGETVVAKGSEVSLRPGLTEPSGGLVDFAAVLAEEIEPGFSDWIELVNNGDAEVNLTGWSLTDEKGMPQKWMFPEGTVLPAGGYLVVMADGLIETIKNAEYLHTNFKLSAGGEYLGLFNAEGTAVTEFDPDYPRQDAFHSYGLGADGTYVYFDVPSPGRANTADTFVGRVDAPDFDVKGGFYEDAVTITLTSETEGAKIRYTTDGTNPTENNGTDYSEPIKLDPVNDDEGHVVRARAFLEGNIASRIKTHTYLIQQHEAFVAAPSLIYAGDVERSLYKPHGVLSVQGGSYSGGNWISRRDTDYNYAMNRGRSYERPIHVEYYMPDGTVGFRTDAGVRLAASNWSRPRMTFRQVTRSPWPWSSATEKPSFNLYFRNDYGNPSVTLPFNGPVEPVDTFEGFRVRAGKNDLGNNGRPFIIDELVRRLYRDMGNVSTTGVINTLYVNGELKGYYNMVERLRSPFFGDHHGNTPGASWDVLAFGNQPQNIAEGDKDAWNDLIGLARGTVSDENWEEILKLADIESISDYYLINIYTSMWDWPHNNWVAARERSDAGRYRFYCWDSEGGFGQGKTVSSSIIDSDLDSGGGELQQLWQRLKRWPQFRLAFADRVHKHFFNGGVLDDRDYENSHLKMRAEELKDEASALLREIARQNLSIRAVDNWAREDRGRRAYLLGPRRDNFARNDLWPDTTPPELSQFGGSVPQGYGLRLTNEVGVIYVTTNGEDPRLPNGEPNPNASSQAGSKVAVSLVEAGSTWKYFDAGEDLGTAWRQVGFDDSGWNSGAAPLGYGGISDTDIATQVNPGRHTATYFRRTIELEDASVVLSLAAKVHVDAGCVVYINGQEALRDGMPDGEITFDSVGTSDGKEGVFDDFEELDVSLLQNGTNVIAIQVHNQSATGGSSDMVVDLSLSAVQTNPENSALLITEPLTVKARAYNDGEWSPLTEADFTVDTVPAASDNLAIAEFLYNPAGPTDTEKEAGVSDGDQFEYLEVRNIGSRNVDLHDVRFTDGISFDFSESAIRTIAPGQHVIIVSDLAAFPVRFGNGNNGMIAGQYVGNLNNGGERIRLTGPGDITLHEFTYDDAEPWPEEGDAGHSLQIIDASGDHADATNWKASDSLGGNPGPEGTATALTLAAWLSTHFSPEELQNEGFSGGSADADGDATSNFAEFVYGTSPRDASDRPESPRGSIIEGDDGKFYLAVTITMSQEARAVSFSGETSTDLAAWNASAVERVSETTLQSGRLEVTFRESAPIDVDSPRYLRLKMVAN